MSRFSVRLALLRGALVFAVGATLCFGQAPEIRAVVNAAGFTASIATGSIATVFGERLANGTAAASSVPLPKQLAGAEVHLCNATFSDTDPRFYICRPMDLIYVSPTQINFIVSISIYVEPGMRIRVRLTKPGSQPVDGPAVFAPTAAHALGIFEIGFDCQAVSPCDLSASSGGGAAISRPAITDNLGRAVTSTNPAKPGGIYSLWFTGYGDPKAFQGTRTGLEDFRWDLELPLYRNPDSSTAISWIGDAEAFYIGPTPQFEGLFQANFRVPNIVASGACRIELGIEIKKIFRLNEPFSRSKTLQFPVDAC